MDETYAVALEVHDSETAETTIEYLVALQTPALQVITTGEQGPPGPPGEGAAAWQQNDW